MIKFVQTIIACFIACFLAWNKREVTKKPKLAGLKVVTTATLASATKKTCLGGNLSLVAVPQLGGQLSWIASHILGVGWNTLWLGTQKIGPLTKHTSDCMIKPCKALAKQTHKSAQVLDLHLTCVSFGHPLAWTCIHFDRAQIWMQVDTSFLLFGHPVQVDTSWSQVICCYKNALTNDMHEIYGFLQFASQLVNAFGRTLRKSICKCWFCKV